MLEIKLLSEQATMELGAGLGGQLLQAGSKHRNGLQIHLEGGLGAGKTTLMRGMLRSLGVQGPVKSPTYTLVEPYPFQDLTVYHFDLYRLGCAEELEFIGFADYCRPGAVCCLEWPQRGQGWLPSADLLIRLESGPNRYTAALQAYTRAGEILLLGAKSA